MTRLVIFKDKLPLVSTFLNPHLCWRMKRQSLQLLSKPRSHLHHFRLITMIIRRGTSQKKTKAHWKQFILIPYPHRYLQYQPRIYTPPLQIPLLYQLPRRYRTPVQLFLLHLMLCIKPYPPLRVMTRTNPLPKVYPHLLQRIQS